MADLPIPFDRFLTELKASLSETSGEAVLRRINAERVLNLLLEALPGAHQGERIRALPDNHLTAGESADFLIQVDEYEIRLELLDAPDGRPAVSTDQLLQFHRILEDNPNTVALILVWDTDDLLSVSLDTFQIQHLLSRASALPEFLATARPFPALVEKVLSTQVRVWETGLDSLASSAELGEDMQRQFEIAFEHALDQERQRPYKTVERRVAADQFPFLEEERSILNIFRSAFSGETAESLALLLAQVARRGGR